MQLTILQYDTSAYDGAGAAAAAGIGFVFILFYFAIILFMLFCLYKIFKKAGREDAWAAFIPIYGAIVQLDIVKRPWYHLFMYLIPFYGIYLAIVDLNRLSKFFGKSEGFTAGLIFLPFIFYPILAFGDAQYNPNALPDDRNK